MPRPQFTLRALLLAMLVVGAFLGGMVLQHRLEAPVARTEPDDGTFHTLKLRDGSEWIRLDMDGYVKATTE
ncbi:MAG TPA: hypothetical protein VHC22_14775 [Pirellulales bacterium]|nr:hypothetical protein [Pirellulales bacterium]